MSRVRWHRRPVADECALRGVHRQSRRPGRDRMDRSEQLRQLPRRSMPSRNVAGNVAFVGTTGPTDVLYGKLGYIASTTKALTEATYAGHATVASVDCSTCHDTSAANDPPQRCSVRQLLSAARRYGSRRSNAARERPILGTSDGTPAGTFNLGNVCISCHRSRKDVTNYILASNTLTSVNWGPHEGPQADVHSGKGGYAFAGMKYGNSSHQAFTNGCVDCHMPAAADTNQGIGNHSFNPQLSTCQHAGCQRRSDELRRDRRAERHERNLQELRVVLNTAGYLTRGTVAPYPILSPTDLPDLTFSLIKCGPGPRSCPRTRPARCTITSCWRVALPTACTIRYTRES